MNPRRLVLLAASLASFLPLVACVGATAGSDPSGLSLHSSSEPAEKEHSAIVCATSLEAYCAGGACYTTWSTADDACMNSASDSVQFSTTCGSSSYLAFEEGDRRSYYDGTSQALVAVFDENGSCLGGPSNFMAPQAASCPLVVCGMQSCGGPDGGLGQ